MCIRDSITHHVEEIPPGFSHALLLREGRIVTAGPLDAALTSETLSDTFAMRLSLGGAAGRWVCRAV